LLGHSIEISSQIELRMNAKNNAAEPAENDPGSPAAEK
jgi:Flp pilus assembly CpaE family ATPase